MGATTSLSLSVHGLRSNSHIYSLLVEGIGVPSLEPRFLHLQGSLAMASVEVATTLSTVPSSRILVMGTPRGCAVCQSFFVGKPKA